MELNGANFLGTNESLIYWVVEAVAITIGDLSAVFLGYVGYKLWKRRAEQKKSQKQSEFETVLRYIDEFERLFMQLNCIWGIAVVPIESEHLDELKKTISNIVKCLDLPPLKSETLYQLRQYAWGKNIIAGYDVCRTKASYIDFLVQANSRDKALSTRNELVQATLHGLQEIKALRNRFSL